jgi:hypothetical protein
MSLYTRISTDPECSMEYSEIYAPTKNLEEQHEECSATNVDASSIRMLARG